MAVVEGGIAGDRNGNRSGDEVTRMAQRAVVPSTQLDASQGNMTAD